MFCEKCGAKLDDSEKFCHVCGAPTKDVWVEDKGKYYYIDEEGYMMTDGYNPDGYYVKSDGSWDSSISQKKLIVSQVGTTEECKVK